MQKTIQAGLVNKDISSWLSFQGKDARDKAMRVLPTHFFVKHRIMKLKEKVRRL